MTNPLLAVVLAGLPPSNKPCKRNMYPWGKNKLLTPVGFDYSIRNFVLYLTLLGSAKPGAEITICQTTMAPRSNTRTTEKHSSTFLPSRGTDNLSITTVKKTPRSAPTRCRHEGERNRKPEKRHSKKNDLRRRPWKSGEWQLPRLLGFDARDMKPWMTVAVVTGVWPTWCEGLSDSCCGYCTHCDWMAVGCCGYCSHRVLTHVTQSLEWQLLWLLYSLRYDAHDAKAWVTVTVLTGVLTHATGRIEWWLLWLLYPLGLDARHVSYLLRPLRLEEKWQFLRPLTSDVI